MARNLTGLVELINTLDFSLSQFQMNTGCRKAISIFVQTKACRNKLTNEVFHFVDAGRADNGCGQERLRQGPRNRNLGHRYTTLFRDSLNPMVDSDQSS